MNQIIYRGNVTEIYDGDVDDVADDNDLLMIGKIDTEAEAIDGIDSEFTCSWLGDKAAMLAAIEGGEREALCDALFCDLARGEPTAHQSMMDYLELSVGECL